MAEIRINTTGGVKLYDADDSHYAQIVAGTITSNTDVMTLGHAAVVMGTKLDMNGNNLILDADADTYLDGGTADDVVDVYVAGAKDWKWGANSINVLSGTTLTIDSGATITNSGTANGFGSADPSSADGDTLGTASAEWSDLYLADGSVIYFGNDQEIKLTHVADTGLALKHTATADDKPVVLTLQTGETDMAANDVIGKIAFQAPDEGTGTDAVLVSGAIQAVAEGNHSSSSNATRLEFMTGASEAATAKMKLSSGGDLTVTSGDIIMGTSGKGIDFSATGDAGGITGSAMSAEILDDYEEGTFTLVPVVDSGSMTLDADKNTGSYVKIGNLVICQGLVTMDDGTGAGGYVGASGMPFTSSTSLAEGQAYSAGSLFISGASSAVAGGVICWIEGANQSFLALRESGTTAAGNTLTDHFDDGTVFTFSISYRTV